MIFDPIIVKKGGGLPDNVRTITLESNNPDGGTVSGGGIVQDGMTVTITATPETRYEFKGWQDGDLLISTDEEYSFVVTSDMSLSAVFDMAKESRLPEGYTELKYVCNPNLGYFTCWNFANIEKYRIQMEFSLSDKSVVGSPFGTYYYYRYGTTTKIGSPYLQCENNAIAVNGDASVNVPVDLNDGVNRIIWDTPKGIFQVNDSVQTVRTGYNTNYQPFGVFSYWYYSYSRPNTNNPATTNSFASEIMDYNLHSLKLWNSTASETLELLSEFVPCLNPDGKVGFYDLVENTFTESANASKPFVAGPVA